MSQSTANVENEVDEPVTSTGKVICKCFTGTI